MEAKMAEVQAVQPGGNDNVQAADNPTDEEIAEAEAAFAQALGSAVVFIGMQSVNDFKDQVSELEKEQEE
jgi:hypothetical protein